MSDAGHKVLKFFDLPFSDVFVPYDEGLSISQPIYVGLLSTDRIIKSLEFFQGEEVEFTLVYDTDRKTKKLGGKSISFKSNRLKFSYACCKLDLFSQILDMSDSRFEDIKSPDGFDFKINLGVPQINEVKSLSVLDSGSEELSIQSKDGSCQFFGKTFNIRYAAGIEIEEDCQVSVTKSYLKHLDSEAYHLSVHNEAGKLLFLNNLGNSGVCLGLSAVSDEDEKTSDFV